MYLESSVFDTQDNANQIARLSWTADTSGAGTAVEFQLRTSPDGATWTPWYGPTSTTDFYTTSGTTAINPIHADGVNDRYVQYRAALVTGNIEFTPILQDVTLHYITHGSGAAVSFSQAFRSNSGSQGGSSGGGAMGIDLLLIVLTAMLTRLRLLCSLLVLVLVTPAASAAYVLTSPGTGYQFRSVGNINGDFYQEIYIQNFGSYQGGPGSASGGGTRYDPLGYGGTGYSGTGNGSGHPGRVIVYQMNKSSDMLIDFLKDQLGTKPRILQSITTPDFTAQFSIDMRAISYSNNTTNAPIVNTQSLNDPFGGTTPMAWDMATDAQAGHTNVDAGKYTYTAGSGPGGSIGTYTYSGSSYDVINADWDKFFDTTDSTNVWSNSTYKPR